MNPDRWLVNVGLIASVAVRREESKSKLEWEIWKSEKEISWGALGMKRGLHKHAAGGRKSVDVHERSGRGNKSWKEGEKSSGPQPSSLPSDLAEQ
ncbi:hypothetical protein ACLOJK_020514 [Asimina triloba]